MIKKVIQKKFSYDKVLLVQFSKAPVAGEVKTRLICELGAQGACHLHQLLTERVMGNLVEGGLAQCYLYSNSPESSELQSIVKSVCLDRNTEIPLRQQVGADLGERMAKVFTDHLLFDQNAQLIDAKDADRKSIVILVGSDCPALDTGYLEQAIIALDEGNEMVSDLVIGPADDGGYVLIAMNRAYLSLFDNIEWGSSRVLSQTLAEVNRLGLRLTLLESLPDIDRPEDLLLLQHYGLVMA